MKEYLVKLEERLEALRDSYNRAYGNHYHAKCVCINGKINMVETILIELHELHTKMLNDEKIKSDMVASVVTKEVVKYIQLARLGKI